MFCFTWAFQTQHWVSVKATVLLLAGIELNKSVPSEPFYTHTERVTDRINCCFLEKSTVKPKLSVFHSYLRCTIGRKQTAFIGKHAEDSIGKIITLFLYTLL